MPTAHHGVVVTRPRRAPYKLRELASQTNATPLDFLTDLLSRHPTYQSAAKEIGVTRETLRLWRIRYGIRVMSEDQAGT